MMTRSFMLIRLLQSVVSDIVSNRLTEIAERESAATSTSKEHLNNLITLMVFEYIILRAASMAYAR